MEGHVFVGNNDPEDVKWLCSLSEPEINMLVSLKKLVLQYAKGSCHVSLAKKVDLKMLRTLGFMVMQSVKGRLKDLQMTKLNVPEDALDGTNLLKFDQEYSISDMTIEDLTQSLEIDEKKRTSAGSSEVAPDSKRPKSN